MHSLHNPAAPENRHHSLIKFNYINPLNFNEDATEARQRQERNSQRRPHLQGETEQEQRRGQEVPPEDQGEGKGDHGQGLQAQAGNKHTLLILKPLHYIIIHFIYTVLFYFDIFKYW